MIRFGAPLHEATSHPARPCPGRRCHRAPAGAAGGAPPVVRSRRAAPAQHRSRHDVGARRRHGRGRVRSLHDLRRLLDRRRLPHDRQRRHLEAGVRTRGGAFGGRHRGVPARPEHHLGGHRRARQPAERGLGRRRLQVHRRRPHLDQRRPARPASTSAASCCIPPAPTSLTWRRRARCGARAASADSTSRATAARPGRARCTSTTTPA